MPQTRRVSGQATTTSATGVVGGSNRQMAPQDVHYLWALVLLEFAALWGLRQGFRRHHGG